MPQQTCRSDTFSATEQFVLEEDSIDFLEPNSTALVGHLVIVPEMEFTCHGYISGWSAVTRLDSNDAAIDNLLHDITFQLWRPSPIDSKIYNFVGSQTLNFIGANLRDGLTVINGTQFFRFTSAQSEDVRLYFQPGDFVGWFIHSSVQSIQRPLTIVHRDVANNTADPSVQPVDMYTTMIADSDRADTPPPCELALCSGQFSRISSVIPYVSVDYGKK